MKLNPFGEVVESVLKEIPLHYPEVNNEVFIVMPNHVHGIISIHEVERAGSKPASTIKPLSEIVRAFKTYSSRRINELRNSQGTPVWQRNYYEHVIRSESDYHQTPSPNWKVRLHLSNGRHRKSDIIWALVSRIWKYWAYFLLKFKNVLSQEVRADYSCRLSFSVPIIKAVIIRSPLSRHSCKNYFYYHSSMICLTITGNMDIMLS